MTRPSRTIVAALAAALGLAAALPAASQPAPERLTPLIRVLISPTTATDSFRWLLPFSVVNPTDSGIYLDSLRVVVENLDPGARRSPSVQSFPAQIRDILNAVSAGDSGVVNFSIGASAEHARIRLVLHTHSAAGGSFLSEAEVDAVPGLVSTHHPSTLLADGKRTIEYVIVPRPLTEKLSPGILMIHDEGTDARVWVPIARDLSVLGISAMVVSLPGYGQSSGPPDFAGRSALRAVHRALDALRRHPRVDSTRVGIWGISQGATVAALVAAKRKDLKAVVLQGAIYDLATTIGATESETLRRLLETESGPRSGWTKRSPLPSKAVFAAPTLILHGRDDRIAPAEQARQYAALLKAAGAEVEVKIVPGTLHVLSIDAIQAPLIEFLEQRLEPVP